MAHAINLNPCRTDCCLGSTVPFHSHRGNFTHTCIHQTHSDIYRGSSLSQRRLKWVCRRCNLDKKVIEDTQSDLITSWLNQALLASISRDRWGLIVSRPAVKTYTCVSECDSIFVSVRLSSWTISQTWDLCLVGKSRGGTIWNLLPEMRLQNQRVWQQDGQRQVVIFSQSWSFYLIFWPICFFVF